MLKKLVTGLSLGTVCVVSLVGSNPDRWSTLSALGFYPPEICSTETSTNYSYQDYKISKEFFAKGGEINQKIINKLKQNDECSLDFLLFLTLIRVRSFLINNGATANFNTL